MIWCISTRLYRCNSIDILNKRFAIPVLSLQLGRNLLFHVSIYCAVCCTYISEQISGGRYILGTLFLQFASH